MADRTGLTRHTMYRLSSAAAAVPEITIPAETAEETILTFPTEFTIETTAGESTEETLATAPTEPSQQEGTGISGWAVAALVLAVVCAVLAVLLWRRSGRGKRKPDTRTRKPLKAKKPEKAALLAEEEAPREVKAPAEGKPAAVLPVQIGKIHEQGARPDQQDSFSVSDLQGLEKYGLLAVVADGMGGLKDGGRVSQCAASTMMEGFYKTEGNARGVLLSLVERTVAAVNAELGESGLYRSGSTLVAAIVKGNKLHFASVGDSRISLYRSGTLMQLNRDHILRRDLEVRAINRQTSWEDAAGNPKAHGLTSFLGMGNLKYVDIPSQPVTLLPGDRVMLMSDGVYNALSDREICAELDKPAQEAADAIRDKVAAKKYQNQDNYTAILLAF